MTRRKGHKHSQRDSPSLGQIDAISAAHQVGNNIRDVLSALRRYVDDTGALTLYRTEADSDKCVIIAILRFQALHHYISKQF
jgi:hypothetical protein